MDLLVWSGGMDSTAILLDYASQKKPLTTLYIELKNNELKTKQEKLARQKIRQILKDDWDYCFEDREVQIGGLKTVNSFSSVAFSMQPMSWLWGTFMGLRSGDAFEKVLYGYIISDVFWHIKEKFVTCYDCMAQGLVVVPGYITVPKVHFPLEWYTKEEVVKRHYLSTAEKVEILKNTWTCEMPHEVLRKRRGRKSVIDIEPCGECDPCKSWKKILQQFEWEDGIVYRVPEDSFEKD